MLESVLSCSSWCTAWSRSLYNVPWVWVWWGMGNYVAAPRQECNGTCELGGDCAAQFAQIGRSYRVCGSRRRATRTPWGCPWCRGGGTSTPIGTRHRVACSTYSAYVTALNCWKYIISSDGRIVVNFSQSVIWLSKKLCSISSFLIIQPFTVSPLLVCHNK